MKPYYQDELTTIYHGDSRSVVHQVTGQGHRFGCAIIDPPFDSPELIEWSSRQLLAPSTLVFTDPAHLGEVTNLYGSMAWLFVWDTMSPWSTGGKRPLTRLKLCAWFGDISTYDRDATLWGDPPPARDHPTTKSTPLEGKRLVDVWQQSLRWLHHPAASTGQAGSERFSKRQGKRVLRHSKPVDWMRCLIGNTSTGAIIDPFMGSGTSVMAARKLGRPIVAIDSDEECCEYAVWRIHEAARD